MRQSIAILPERAVVEITGQDRQSFLQGLVTTDIEALAEGSASHAGLLTPQGKIMFDFFVVGQQEGYLIDCSASQLDDLVKRLTFYKLRAKVDITIKPELAVASNWAGKAGTSDALLVFDDPRLTAMGQRVIGENSVLKALSNETAAAYHLHRIKNGVPDTSDIGSSQTFPHEANFDQLGGVNFNKGCFVGQEVVSRMQHRGTARSRIVPATFDGGVVMSGAVVSADGKKIGQMLSVVNGHGLALVRLDRARSALEAGVAIEVEGTNIELHKPAWMKIKM